MSTPLSDLAQLLASMEPVLHDAICAYCVLPHGTEISRFTPVVTVAEAEGLTLVIPEPQALAAGLAVRFRAAWITLTVHSDLHAVGLTAAFASALGNAGIGCNVVAGAFHDHLFVPAERAQDAMAALHRLQAEAESGGRASGK